LDFVMATVAVDNAHSADWVAFALACGVPVDVGAHASRREDGQPLTDLRLDDGDTVLISVRLARAVGLGASLAADRQERVVAPRHVVWGALADDSSDAAAWFGSGLDHLSTPAILGELGDHLFGSDLPDPAKIGRRAPGEDVALPPINEPSISVMETALILAGQPKVRRRVRVWAAGVGAALVLLAGGFVRTMGEVRDAARHDRRRR
jgi:hypothetical protein